jgi:hypothetical protein
LCFGETLQRGHGHLGMRLQHFREEAPRSPKFGGKSEIALSSGDE